MLDQGWLSLSPSSINVIEDCARCGWRQFKGVSRPRGIFPSLPGGIDRVAKAELDKHRKNGEWPPLFRNKTLAGRPLLQPPRSRLTFADSSLKVRLVGILDDAYELDGKVGPLDIKTRGSKAVETHAAYVRQMQFYHLLLGANGWTPTGKAVLVYLIPCEGAMQGGIPFEVDVKEVLTDEEDALALIAKAAAILRGPMPPPAAGCEYCRWFEAVKRQDRELAGVSR